MGNIAEQLSLLGHQRLDTLCHMVKILCEPRELILPVAHFLSNTHRQFTGSQSLRRVAQLDDRCGQVTGEPVANPTRYGKEQD